ncbi:MAG: hypothetical protein V2B18_16180 [Pseudomonadota bacterium]
MPEITSSHERGDTPNPARILELLKEKDGHFRALRQKGRAAIQARLKDEQIIERQGSDSDPDPFQNRYDRLGLLEPRYKFKDLFDLVEESDTLQSCITAMAQGVDGNGHDFQFTGPDTEREAPENRAILRRLRDFFDNVNEDGSFISVRKRLRCDLESVGNAALEIVRSATTGMVEQIYHVPITYLRMSRQDRDRTPYRIRLPRDGEPVLVTRRKKFRRYARSLPDGSVRWYKEFGDPRGLDAVTGDYSETPKEAATELWWFKVPFRNFDYGAPRWIGCLSVVKARSLAHFVNYDLFNNQGIPPMLIVVEDGQLTDASLDEIENTIESWRDPGKFNRVCILQAEPNLLGMSQDSRRSAVQIHQLRHARAEDYMFKEFLTYSDEMIRRAFRLPPLHLGGTETYNLATAYASRITAEQQVFAPLRRSLDEALNLKLLRNELNITAWRFRSRGPRVAGSEELAKIVATAAKSGGPSFNQLIELWNEALGTDWSTSDNPLYKMPSEIALLMVKQSRVTIDQRGELSFEAARHES